MTDDRQRMKDIDHTHPYDDRSAGALFARGPVVAADGGEPSVARRTSKDERSESFGSERNSVSRSSSEETSDGGERATDSRASGPRSDGGRRDTENKERMKDVDHTPPHNEEGAKRVFERGEEYDDEGLVVEE